MVPDVRKAPQRRKFFSAVKVAPEAIQKIDRLERACIAGDLPQVQALFERDIPFVYSSFALAAAMHAGHVEVARYLLDAGVHLLAAPDASAAPDELLPPADTFTRFALTEKSVGLLRHPQEPTASDVIFSPFKPTDPLVGGPFEEGSASAGAGDLGAEVCCGVGSAGFDLQRACACVEELAAEGRFDATTFDDVTRAALVRAWKALRHKDSYDMQAFDTCTALVTKLLALHAAGSGDKRLDRMLSYMVVPRAAWPMLQFVAQAAPGPCAQAAAANVAPALDDTLGHRENQALPWLLQDHGLLGRLVECMPCGGAPEDNHTLLCALARTGELAAVRKAMNWDFADVHASLLAAMEQAAQAGYAQISAELFQAAMKVSAPASGPQTVEGPFAPETFAARDDDLFL